MLGSLSQSGIPGDLQQEGRKDCSLSLACKTMSCLAVLIGDSGEKAAAFWKLRILNQVEVNVESGRSKGLTQVEGS